MTSAEYLVLQTRYGEAQNNGLGDSPEELGLPESGLNDYAGQFPFGQLLAKSTNDTEIAIYDGGDNYLCVGDVNGPWIIAITKW